MGIFHQAPVGGCDVCARAATDRRHPDHRNNPSILLQSPTGFNVVVDVGKTFHSSACDFFPQHGVLGVDAVVLTHEHADAILGLDDLRVVQRPVTMPELRPNRKASVDLSLVVSAIVNKSTNKEPPQKKALATEHYWTGSNETCTVYCSEQTKAYVQSAFPYLTKGGGGGRFVSKLVFESFKLTLHDHDFTPINIPKYFANDKCLTMYPLPIEHGPNYVSAGYLIGPVVYLSDISSMPQATREFIKSHPFSILIIDCLRAKHPDSAAAPVHFDLESALSCIESLGPPPCSWLTGIGHELPHDETDRALKLLPVERFGSVQCAYDGLCIELPSLV